MDTEVVVKVIIGGILNGAVVARSAYSTRREQKHLTDASAAIDVFEKPRDRVIAGFIIGFVSGALLIGLITNRWAEIADRHSKIYIGAALGAVFGMLTRSLQNVAQAALLGGLLGRFVF